MSLDVVDARDHVTRSTLLYRLNRSIGRHKMAITRDTQYRASLACVCSPDYANKTHAGKIRHDAIILSDILLGSDIA